MLAGTTRWTDAILFYKAAWCSADLGPAFTVQILVNTFIRTGKSWSYINTMRLHMLRAILTTWCMLWWNGCSFSHFLLISSHRTWNWSMCVNVSIKVTVFSSLQTTCCCYVKMNICPVLTRLNVCTTHSVFYLIYLIWNNGNWEKLS